MPRRSNSRTEVEGSEGIGIWLLQNGRGSGLVNHESADQASADRRAHGNGTVGPANNGDNSRQLAQLGERQADDTVTEFRVALVAVRIEEPSEHLTDCARPFEHPNLVRSEHLTLEEDGVLERADACERRCRRSELLRDRTDLI